METHKPDLQQILDNLTGEESEEEQKHKGEFFSGDSENTAHRLHQKGKRKHRW